MSAHDEMIGRLREKIRSAIGTRLDAIESKLKRNNTENVVKGAKTQVFTEFAELVRQTVNIDPVIQQAIEERLAETRASLNAEILKTRLYWEELKEQQNALQAEKDANPELQRMKNFVEMLDLVVPIPRDSRSQHNGSYQQALRSRGMAFAAFHGLQCLGGFKQAEADNMINLAGYAAGVHECRSVDQATDTSSQM